MELNKSMPLQPKRLVTEFYCEVCDIYVTSQVTLDAHIVGQKHKTRLQWLQEAPVEEVLYYDPQVTDFYCKICKIYASSQLCLQDHFSGQKHHAQKQMLEDDARSNSNYDVSERGIITSRINIPYREKPESYEPRRRRNSDDDDISKYSPLYSKKRHEEKIDVRKRENEGRYREMDRSRSKRHRDYDNKKDYEHSSRGKEKIINKDLKIFDKYAFDCTKTSWLENAIGHRKRIVGLDFIIEFFYKNNYEIVFYYECQLCSFKCKGVSIVKHIHSLEHEVNAMKKLDREKYLKLLKYYSSKLEIKKFADEWARYHEKKYGCGVPKIKPLGSAERLIEFEIKRESSSDDYADKAKHSSKDHSKALSRIKREDSYDNDRERKAKKYHRRHRSPSSVSHYHRSRSKSSDTSRLRKHRKEKIRVPIRRSYSLSD